MSHTFCNVYHFLRQIYPEYRWKLLSMLKLKMLAVTRTKGKNNKHFQKLEGKLERQHSADSRYLHSYDLIQTEWLLIFFSLKHLLHIWKTYHFGSEITTCRTCFLQHVQKFLKNIIVNQGDKTENSLILQINSKPKLKH